MKKMPPISIRFDPDVKAKLDAEAAEQMASLAWVVNKALREHYKLTAPKPKVSKPK